MVCIKSTILFILVITLGCYSAQAQNASLDSTIIGVWKGTSICQVQNTPCHDEIVVYYITKGDAVDSIRVNACKIVDGKEEEMGVIEFRLDRKNKSLTSNDNGALWRFDLRNGKLKGTLYYKGTCYRVINLEKQL